MERITEEIYFDDGTRGLRFHPAVPNGCVVEAGRYYSFELGRKSVVFGDVPVQQFWMPLDSIYRPPLKTAQIRRWARDYRREHRRWPTKTAGLIPKSDGETWMAVAMALSKGNRGLTGGTTLHNFLRGLSER